MFDLIIEHLFTITERLRNSRAQAELETIATLLEAKIAAFREKWKNKGDLDSADIMMFIAEMTALKNVINDRIAEIKKAAG